MISFSIEMLQKVWVCLWCVCVYIHTHIKTSSKVNRNVSKNSKFQLAVPLLPLFIKFSSQKKHTIANGLFIYERKQEDNWPVHLHTPLTPVFFILKYDLIITIKRKTFSFRIGNVKPLYPILDSFLQLLLSFRNKNSLLWKKLYLYNCN